ncbi:hypothetical protein [Streptomyces sp. TE3672]
MASEKRLLTTPTFRGEGRTNSYMAGLSTFDRSGNLYVATGDNTVPFTSNGFTPIEEQEADTRLGRPGTSANTTDLRDKILRITPKDDGTYSIPECNLFALGTEKTRAKNYAVALRNPFRIATDRHSSTLLAAD